MNQSTEILNLLSAGTISPEQALSQLLELGMNKDIAEESIYIVQGGTDLIEEPDPSDL
jgi:hypothetical protein